ncbi:5-hydroxytryptamine receptor 3A [Archocentrus centrarchus]|uniref:5-hydroxytryptamine receptor 3A n=1 Tax=Archocentrus centrarchus TaxID=63155 RepID=UPI0011E9B472|nr:5-hydroxytryptamine receptor 3A-like [Archocentrus centrarchus]
MAALRTLAFISVIVRFSSSQTTDCSYFGLLEHLNLIDSNTALETMRPVKNWTSATFVQLDMFVLAILEADEKTQTFTNQIMVYMTWTNEFLTWNPSEFCGIEKMTILRSMLWIPDVVIAEDVSDDGSIQTGSLVTVYSNGSVNANFRQRLTFACRLNLIMFPFDVQTCPITFFSPTSGVESMNLGTLSDKAFLAKVSDALMLTRGEWQLKSIDISTITDKSYGNKSKVEFLLTMERKPVLYVINLIMPLFYFLVMDLASFFISDARGEKLSFKVTLLLSIAVLLLLLQDMLPSTEKNLPMIATYCTVIFTLVAASVLEAMLVMFLFDFEGFSCCKKTQNCGNVEMDIQPRPNILKESGEAEEKGEVKPEKSDPHCDFGLLDAAQEDDGRPNKSNGRHGRYRRLAEIIDHVFFVLYFIGSALFLVFIYLVWIPKAL